MNKILYLIPAILLVGAGILLIQGNQNSLSADNDQVTFSQYYDCMYDKNVYHRDICTQTEKFQQTKEKVEQYLNTNPTCIAYAQYTDKVFALNILATAALNQDQLYQNCRASPEFLAIVQQDYDCLYTKFISPELKLCSGLNL
ncbi:transmembrane protein, putative (macronuclear) [Tetrahymena thermophila SB210]|uniref:Transmembrane protein, putative n=1 Tax=Tetrahymena thermophila (strain SB210) TaxID=312017 RepID=Q22EB0_TETTS|nr:transmembrane protein, putative [Tetrahymena thermophila SB210]EAR83618.1 transmembrane protein, putative [Tetrahymena thermophila SB210]|eukprot:XP_001031281.1 transmembrane protein, putative [Tetrahymena thermophila SB210]